ncbi:MAG: hypothetical protein MR270_07670 [Erysipelotrichaceae bacterium]|nr:hypothetical protein [Erysipelotrichaceae bacterium]
MKKKIYNFLLNLFFITLLFFSFMFSSVINNGFKEAFNFIITIIIPSLFPFMIFVNFVLLSNSIDYLCIIFKPIGKIFNLSSYAIICIVSSLLGGYPYNAILISTFLKQNKINNKEASRLLLTSFFPSLSFLFFTLKPIDNNFTYIIISLYIASFLTLFVTSFKKNCIGENKNEINKINDFTSIYFEVMKKSISSICVVSFSIIFFSLITSLLSNIIKNNTLILFISGILEFSNASVKILLLENKSFIHYLLLNIIISFSSFSILFQSLFYLKDNNISIKKLLLQRIIICLISTSIFSLLYLFLNKTFT